MQGNDPRKRTTPGETIGKWHWLFTSVSLPPIVLWVLETGTRGCRCRYLGITGRLKLRVEKERWPTVCPLPPALFPLKPSVAFLSGRWCLLRTFLFVSAIVSFLLLLRPSWVTSAAYARSCLAKMPSGEPEHMQCLLFSEAVKTLRFPLEP